MKFSSGVADEKEIIPGIKESQYEVLEALPEDMLQIDRNTLVQLNRSPNGLSGNSKVEVHGEGLCLNADTRDDNEKVVSYVYFKVKIDENHKFLTAYARTFFGQNGGSYEDEAAGNFANSKLAELGVYVLDENGNLVSVGELQRIDSEDYKALTYDLSAYEGQTVVLVIGNKTGYHCCVDKMEFSSTQGE